MDDLASGMIRLGRSGGQLSAPPTHQFLNFIQLRASVPRGSFRKCLEEAPRGK